MFKDKLNFKLLNLLILLVIFYIVISTVNLWGEVISKLISIISPFAISFAIAYSMYPLVRKLQEKGVRKNLAVTLIVVLISSLIFGLILITIPLVYDQIIILSRLISEVVSDISLRFSINLGGFEDSVKNVLNNIITKMGNYVSTGTLDIVGKSVDFVTKFIIIYIVSIYFLSGMDDIRYKTKSFLRKKGSKYFNYFKIIDKELGNYLLGLVIFMVIQLFEYCFLFFIVGHPNWLLLGILASITTVVPYFGGLITNIIAVALASAVSTNLFIATLIICLVFPNIDSYIISPRVYGKTNNISPLWTIFSIFACGALFGFIGILVALPIYIIINRTYHFFEGDIKDRIDDIKISKRTKKQSKI